MPFLKFEELIYILDKELQSLIILSIVSSSDMAIITICLSSINFLSYSFFINVTEMLWKSSINSLDNTSTSTPLLLNVLALIYEPLPPPIIPTLKVLAKKVIGIYSIFS